MGTLYYKEGSSGDTCNNANGKESPLWLSAQGKHGGKGPGIALLLSYL